MTIKSALSFLSPDPREFWVEMAMAIKSELGEAGFDTWNRWSQQSDAYRAADAKAVWRSIRGRGITIRSLYKAARERGWQGTGAAPEQRRSDSAAKQAAEDARVQRDRQRAATRAAEIIAKCQFGKHAYLHTKGFPEMQGLVHEPEIGDLRLVIPMYVGKKLVNVQEINRDCQKKFLFGGQAGGAEHVFDAHGMDVLCEGYATGLSVRAAMDTLRMRYRIHVTFSANNMVRIARGLSGGVVIADNDESGTGERVARQIGWPYWMSDVVGEDCNDAMRRLGLFRLSQAMRQILRREAIAA